VKPAQGLAAGAQQQRWRRTSKDEAALLMPIQASLLSPARQLRSSETGAY